MGVMTTRRSYRQLCGLAAALDVVGERWTMLIVRDLSLGPRRYGELLEGLPGIGEGLLAQRLRHLEAEELVQRTFSTDVGAVVYELTEAGHDLWAAMVPLAAWGLQRVGPIDDEDVRADWLAVAVQARYEPSRSVGLHETYEMRIDDEPYTITANDGSITVERGEATDPAVRVTLDLDTVMQIGIGQLTVAGAREAGLTKLEGTPEAITRYGTLLRGLQ
ncbi:MAG: crotonobetainyl-CoA--carnitine CoA-transferase [Actinomycetia bacterium]|nr:crotonobetainyl-CoA--carnitine CoA-transferase [Actinomycetes bacterium]